MDPTFLTDSDVRADRLGDLRDTGSRRTRVSLGFRKTTPMANPLLGAVMDGLEGNVAWYKARSSTVTSRLEASGMDLRLGYDRRLEPREFDPIPGFMEGLVRLLLPEPLEDKVLDSRVRWSPERFIVGTSFSRQDNRIFRYQRIIETPEDSLVTPTEAPREALESAAEVTFRPLGSLTADLTFLSTRDLLRPEDVVADPDVQQLLEDQRAEVAGVDLGWETNRSLRTTVSYRPRVVPWLRHDLTFTTRYDSDRNPGFVGVIPQPLDSLVFLQRNASGERSLRTFVALPARRAGPGAGWGGGG